MRMTRQEVREEIDRNRNHSLAKEVFIRHANEMNRIILDYFGNEISYQKLFDEATRMAVSLKQNGLKKGDEMIVCLDRIPELVYLLLAASMVGAKINIISEKFNEEYIKEIANKANYKYVFIQDNKYEKLKNVIEDLKNNNSFVTVSHERSLPIDNKFEDVLSTWYKKSEKISGDNVIDYDSFLKTGIDYGEFDYEDVNLDDPFTITYSSGTTKKGLPKGILHKVRHYITMGRYHDPEVSGLPSLKNYSTYSNIPSYSNSWLLSALSDNLVLGGKIILDPIDNPEYFLMGVKLHKSHVNIATTTTWITAALNYYQRDKEYIEDLPYALFNFVAGEQFSAGEEKFLNNFFKDAKCGVKVTHTPISVAKACTAGADCEHGSVFIKLFRAIFNKAPYRIGRSEPAGMKPYDFVDVQVLRRDGTYCLPLEHGRLVANSDCNMIGYNHNEEATENFYIKDAYGNVWGDMKAYGFKDERGNVSMKGRYSDDGLIPTYLIADEILKDTKKIMSCEVVPVEYNGNVVYVAHIMPQYKTSFNAENVIKGAIQRCIKKFGYGIQNVLYFRIHSLEEKFPIAESSKRDIRSLEQEKLDNVYIIDNNNQKSVNKQLILK